jgi:tetratricopeptide (TPR) repeat protein
MQSDLLLSDEQRGAKRERLQAGRFQEWADQFHRSLAERSFEQADQCLARLDAELPGDPRTDALRDELADARTDARADDLRQSREHVEGLMAVGRFDEAVRSAESAAGRHPDSDEAAELLARSRREAEAFNTERVRRLYDEVRRHAEARRWSDALAAARQLIDRHGQTGEAQLVSANLPTLEGNARLEEVRQLRDRIRDLLQRKRYRDALDLAREVIQRYPETAAAMELREQMGRLRELAMEG